LSLARGRHRASTRQCSGLGGVCALRAHPVTLFTAFIYYEQFHLISISALDSVIMADIAHITIFIIIIIIIIIINW